MRKISFLWFHLVFFAMAINLNAQINANPDPKGEPWWVGGEWLSYRKS